MTPHQAANRLAGLPIADTLAASLAKQAAALASQVQAELASPPGGPHTTPWRETGKLQASIAYSSDGLAAAVGTNSPAAAPQELGTASIPPRPFLAPPAAIAAEPMARAIGAALADMITRHLT